MPNTIAEELTRITTDRNTIRAKAVELGIAQNNAGLDELATAIEAIENKGAVSATVQEGDTYTIPKGYHNGSGTVSGVAGGGSYNLQSKANDVTIFSSGRVKVLPFNRHFEPEEQDKTLKKRLEKELSGVLNWCLDGLWLTRETGFEPPKAVLQATAQYRYDSDKLTRFVEEMLVPDPLGEVSTTAVYSEYQDWCTHNGQQYECLTTFKRGLESVGEVRRKRPQGAGKTANPIAMLCGFRLT